jgi:hypothetical protein
MRTYLYRCPITGFKVQGYSPDQTADDDDADTYEAVRCPACAQMHLVNPVSGKVAGQSE